MGNRALAEFASGPRIHDPQEQCLEPFHRGERHPGLELRGGGSKFLAPLHYLRAERDTGRVERPASFESAERTIPSVRSGHGQEVIDLFREEARVQEPALR